MATNSSKYSVENFLTDVEKWKEELEQSKEQMEAGQIPSEKYETAKIKFLNDVKRNLKFINEFDSPEQKNVILQLSKKMQNTRKITPDIVNGYLNENFDFAKNEQEVIVEENIEGDNKNGSSFKTINEENNQRVEDTINRINELNKEFEELYNQDVSLLSQEELEQRRKKLEDFQTSYKELKSVLNNIKQKTRTHIKGLEADKEDEKKLDLELINKIENQSIIYMEPLKKIEMQLEDMQNSKEHTENEDAKQDSSEVVGENNSDNSSEQHDYEEGTENNSNNESPIVEDETNKEEPEKIETSSTKLQDEEFYEQSQENESNFENIVGEDTGNSIDEFDVMVNQAEEYAKFDEQQEQEQYKGLEAEREILQEDERLEQQESVEKSQKLSDEEFYKQTLENEANFEKMVEEYGNNDPDELAMEETLRKVEDHTEVSSDTQPIEVVEQIEDIEEAEDLEETQEKDYINLLNRRIDKYIDSVDRNDIHKIEEKLGLMENYISRNIETGSKQYRQIRKVFKRIFYDDVDFNGDEFVSNLFDEGRPQYLEGKLSREDRERINESISIYMQKSVDGEIPDSEVETFDKFVLAPYKLKIMAKEKNREKENSMVEDLKDQTVSQEDLELMEGIEFEEVTYRRGKDDQIK